MKQSDLLKIMTKVENNDLFLYVLACSLMLTFTSITNEEIMSKAV